MIFIFSPSIAPGLAVIVFLSRFHLPKCCPFQRSKNAPKTHQNRTEKRETDYVYVVVWKKYYVVVTDFNVDDLTEFHIVGDMKTSFHIKETLEYILYAEMEGIVEKTDPYYSAYVSLLDLLEKVRDDEAMLTD